MKKAYCKPDILFEDFSLSTNIAGDCDVKTNTPSANSCGLDLSGVEVFLSFCGDIKVDAIDGGADGEYNGVCYHVFSNGNNLFNS